jgi:hypothetical protein
MIVKNITGESRYFGFGRATFVRGRLLAANATYSIPDNDPVSMAAVQAFVAAGELQIVEGPANNAVLASSNLPAAGYIRVTGTATNNDTVTVAGQVFEFKADPGSAVLGKYNSGLSNAAYLWAGAGAAAATAAAHLVTAINANSDDLNVVAGTAVLYDTGVYVIPLYAKDGTVTYTGLTLAKSGTNLAVSGTVFAAGVQGPARKTLFTTRAVVAADATAGVIVIATGWASVSNVLVVLRTAAGAAKAWDGKATLSGGNIVLDNTGSTDFADTDVFSVFAQE